jgi:hypothetical protein
VIVASAARAATVRSVLVEVNALALAAVGALLLGMAVSLLTGGPRELLTREAWSSAPFALASLWLARPVCRQVTRTMFPHRA